MKKFIVIAVCALLLATGAFYSCVRACDVDFAVKGSFCYSFISAVQGL